jgi:hypothetical protein
MLIELSKDQERKLLELVAANTRAEVDADCEPSGYELVISVGGPFGSDASVRLGSTQLDLGEVSIVLSTDAAETI